MLPRSRCHGSTSSQPHEEQAEREPAQSAAYRVKAAPPYQQSGGISTPRVECRIEQSVIRWQNHDEGERDHRVRLPADGRGN
jgi:hypothetical protein